MATRRDHGLRQPALRTAELLELGVTRGELAGPRWLSPLQGIRLPAGCEVEDPAQRLLTASRLLPPGAALGGWAAAMVLGCSELDGRGPYGVAHEPVDLVLPPPAQLRRRAGIQLRFSALPAQELVHLHGVPVTAPVRTAFDIGRWTPFPESVAQLDVMGRALRLDLGLVAALVRDRPGWRGVPALRRALLLADPRARSRGETRMRLLWTLEAGLAAPEVNPTIRAADGRFLGIVDLLDIDSGLVGEYDGSGHREPTQHADDNAREEWLEEAGLTVVRLGSADLGRARRRRSVERLRVGHRRALQRSSVSRGWTWQPAKIDIDVRHAF